MKTNGIKMLGVYQGTNAGIPANWKRTIPR